MFEFDREEINAIEFKPPNLERKFHALFLFKFQMYGEKVEEAEELRLDLADVKEMYKTQIQELLNSGSSVQAMKTE